MFLWHRTIMVVDNRSKHFTDIVNFLRKKKIITIRVDPLKFNLKRLKAENIDGVIISGGSLSFIQKKRDFNFSVIRLFKDKPILGICLGHEFLAEFYKSALYRMRWRAQGLSYIYIRRDNDLIQEKKRILVYKGHSLAVGILPDCMKQLAWSSDCEDEMIEHKTRPHFGVQFHPEMSSDGRLILENFLNLCRKRAS